MPTQLELAREAVRRRRRRERQALAPLTPEQEAAEQSLLDDLYGGTMTGVGFAADVLDTPASWVRRGLTGENPFGETLSSEGQA